MTRLVRKEYRLTEDEAKDFARKAEMTCMSEAALVRKLISGYEPREAPGKQFHEDMNRIEAFAKKIESMASAESSEKLGLDGDIRELLLSEVDLWRDFQMIIERRYVTPAAGVLKG